MPVPQRMAVCLAACIFQTRTCTHTAMLLRAGARFIRIA